MYRKIVILLLSLCSLYAEKIEINAKIFEGNKDNQTGVFSKDVSIRQGKDYLNCQILTIRTNKDNKIASYEAQYVTSFSISLNKDNFKGKADKIVYDVNKNTYELIGNVKITENNKELSADYIYINQNDGTYKVNSDKANKPVKLIFEIAK
ncbi:lipopolysaccharide transport periplasmic protein LptA [Campylobacter sp. 2018MI27]|uniref:lipopolysaccharide transport periplasmic protein LptA n=1 Tax=Campylobacter sp. 2018MI27 TaxID=2836738 RepID=UPI001BDAB4B7|nr:lipopolysaccharide transport periplasmic protein LptA [Campylobacter sp. 2018MI27]MBT0881272.1 lipopolysaccharide transport periplasmic protein LptA [Campylobacter sp. 2018MI27]